MSRNFSHLAIALSFAIVLTIAVGLWYAFLPDSSWRNEVFIVHFFLGLTTAILILFVHCVIFIYFLGTGRWVKEVALAYQLPDEPYPKQTRELKRATFPPALYSMLIGIATAAAGAGAQLQDWPWWIHASLAAATVLINLWAFNIEFRNVSINAGIIQAVMAEVERIRAERGYNTNAEALLEQE